MKPADLDLQCFQTRINPGPAKQEFRSRTTMEQNILFKAHGMSRI